MAILLPYSVHSYGVVQTYAMGVPLLVPSPRLLARWHSSMGFVNHKGPGNAPWRRSTQKRRVPNDGYAWLTHDTRMWFTPAVLGADARGCHYDPNDACTPEASEAWLRFSEPYAWPHVTLFDSVEELVDVAAALLANRTRRREISDGMKAFVRAEHARALGHAHGALQRAMRAARASTRAEGGSRPRRRRRGEWGWGLRGA